uniref:Cop number control protein n=1 Tax=Candidatus Phytoplasma tritici TaxID=321961 RepID=K7W952_9MOLU|nr:DUF2963 domain-containing protein [Candidatus Phytoplasma tritici]AFW98260.1 cop number control protein [Candidatus Phytoplasma tritici]
MQTNNQKKSKNKIFIIWGLFISGVILVILIILLLAMKPKSIITNKTIPQQEQETYNRLMNKIEKEIDDLTKTKQEQKSTLKYPNKIITLPNGFLEITEYNQDTGKKIKYTELKINQNGNEKLKVIFFDENEKDLMIDEYDPQTGKFIKRTHFNPDGTIKETKTY